MVDTQKDKNLELARQLQAAIEGATEYINTLKTEIGSLERESVPRQDPIQRTVLFFMRFPRRLLLSACSASFVRL